MKTIQCETFLSCYGTILFPTIQSSKQKLDINAAIAILMERLEGENRMLKLQQEILRDQLFLDTLQMYSSLAVEEQLEKTKQYFVEAFSQLSSPYFQERLKDIADICVMLKKIALNMSISYPSEDCILYVEELSPYDILHLPKNIKGIVLKNNSMQTHTSILLKEHYIPFVNGIDLHDCLYQKCLFFDNQLFLKPSTKVQNLFKEHQIKEQTMSKNLKLINLSSVNIPDVPFDGIGLFRTEMHALRLGYIPSLKEQHEYYKQLDIGKPVRIRLFDFGEDKQIDNSKERGLQYLKQNPDVLRTQLRSILMCNCNNFEILIPMVNSVEDVRFIKGIVNELCLEHGYTSLKIGCMIETPSAVFDLLRIIEEVDFINIGTNDLTRFVFATTRENPIYDNNVLGRVLDYIIEVAKKHEKPYYICGEIHLERT